MIKIAAIVILIIFIKNQDDEFDERSSKVIANMILIKQS